MEHVRTATFWDSPNSIINRILKGILGDFRVVTLGDEVIGVRMVIKS
ncbi:MAG TPA: hypothetical protein PLZ51_19050 [Aggregatilineales bacterium]|nr:hypothetical protein [Aggregatilineales bacterium]